MLSRWGQPQEKSKSQVAASKEFSSLPSKKLEKDVDTSMMVNQPVEYIEVDASLHLPSHYAPFPELSYAEVQKELQSIGEERELSLQVKGSIPIKKTQMPIKVKELTNQ